jgi:hypothetical protein
MYEFEEFLPEDSGQLKPVGLRLTPIEYWDLRALAVEYDVSMTAMAGAMVKGVLAKVKKDT